MEQSPTTEEKRIRLSPERVDKLRRLSEVQQVSEDQIIEQALDLLFRLTEETHESTERERWSSLSEAALTRVWDNDTDANYDNWRELYGPAAR